jgi:hypothetical protein
MARRSLALVLALALANQLVSVRAENPPPRPPMPTPPEAAAADAADAAAIAADGSAQFEAPTMDLRAPAPPTTAGGSFTRRSSRRGSAAILPPGRILEFPADTLPRSLAFVPTRKSIVVADGAVQGPRPNTGALSWLWEWLSPTPQPRP